MTDVGYWVVRQTPGVVLPRRVPPPSWFRRVRSFLPRSPGVRCLEVGVVPGRTLLFLASELGYDCSGIDFSPRLRDVSREFERMGVAARFIEADFLEWSTDERFDLVFSCGFVEHFGDYRSVIERHWDLVKPGGLLLLTTPSLAPFQRMVRGIALDREVREDIHSAHNAAIMNLGRLREVVSGCPGSEVLVSCPVGGMHVWIGRNTQGLRRGALPLLAAIRVLDGLLRPLGWSSALFSPEVLVLARKRLP